MAQTSKELYIRETGAKDAPAILFLHGSPLSSRMWEPQLSQLTEYHCIAPDLPGHGKSSGVPLTDMRSITAAVATLVRERAANGRAHLVGLSFGGVVAQALMIHYPELVDHVILSGTATRLPGWIVSSAGLNEPILRILSPQQLAWLISLQFGIPKHYMDMMREDFATFSSRTILNVLKTYRDIEMPSATQSPTLVCVGSKETIAAKSSARALVRGSPGAKGVVIPGGGHVWNMEKADLFTAMVRAWITGKGLPTELVPLTP